MYKFIPVICLTIFVAACAAPISQQAKRDLASPVDCSTAQSDMRILEQEKDSVMKEIKEGVTAIAPAGAVIGIISGTELDKLKVGSHYYNHQINKKIAEIKRECGVGSSVDGDQAAAEMFYSLDMNHDGTIAREELMIIYPDAVILAEEYTHFDQNGDGTIVEEEFVEAY
jgi:hypothetical protein